MTTPYDIEIHSPVAMDTGDGSGLRHLTWKEWAGKLEETNRELRFWATLVQDLDRSPHGRHIGDAEVQDPSGISRGNPLLPEGQILGFTMSGTSRAYVIPGRLDKHKPDPAVWIRDVSDIYVPGTIPGAIP